MEASVAIQTLPGVADDDELCRIVEPNVCNTRRRIEVLEKMKKRGIPTVVWLSPILPYINDTPENISAILNACQDAGVSGIMCFSIPFLPITIFRSRPGQIPCSWQLISCFAWALS